MTVQSPPAGVPDLGDVAGEWVTAAELAHLPSLRNQVGQGHVNADLTSLSWLAAPPFSFGYHTGVLRVDGEVRPAQRFRWKPWGVEREHSGPALTIRSDTRMVLGEDTLLWEISAVNRTGSPVSVTLSQDLFAMVTRTDTGWGWLYDVPWNAGNYHDFMTLERIRSAVTSETEPDHLLGRGPRTLRLGKPRLPGIQRETASEAMSLDYELPRHVSDDTFYPYRDGADATVRHLRCQYTLSGVGGTIVDLPGEIVLKPGAEVPAGSFELRPGQLIELELRLETSGQSGIILTHGNHPDSLQLGVEDDRLWLAIAGERARAPAALADGRWHQVRIALAGQRVVLSVDGKDAVISGDWAHSARWHAVPDGAAVVISDSRSAARACYAFDTAPGTLRTAGAGATAAWTLELAPHESASVGIACAYGDSVPEVTARAARAASHFRGTLASTEDGYRELWRGAFTPGNPHFSGHLPVLRAADAGLAKSYYMAALVMIYMRNTHASPTAPVFLTGGPRLGPTTTFFWDHAEWSRLYALLDPEGMRTWILHVLGSPYGRSFGVDTRNGGPLGNHYAANDYALFRLTEHYVCVTGDAGFLDEEAGGLPVLVHLDRFAHGWRARRTPETGGVLADFGADPWTLLECVPGYVNVVASLNAAYAGMMRSFADLLRVLGRDADAVTADHEAQILAREVTGLFVPGGRWRIRHPGQSETIGHCLDFGLVAAHLAGDLSERQRTEAVQFVSKNLLASTWMRALALDDPAASLASRPDHGAAGAFCAWPGVTAYGLARLGRPDLAAELLGVVHASSSGALWGQAMEIVAGTSGLSVRVAEDGAANRDSIAAAATAEAIIAGLFGFEPGFRTLAGSPLPDQIDIPETGSLSGINVRPSHRR